MSVENRSIMYWKNVKFTVELSCSLVFGVVLVCSRYLGYLLLPHGLAVPFVLYCGFASTQPLLFVTAFVFNYELQMSLSRGLSATSWKERLWQCKEKWEKDVFIQCLWSFPSTKLNHAITEGSCSNSSTRFTKLE